MQNGTYKAHLFASLGNNKLHTSRTQCGRHLYRNSRGTMVVKTSEFKNLYFGDQENVCSKCLEWAMANNKIK
jgi:hypothetical protein